MARVDCTLLGCARSIKSYKILGHEGQWKYSHETGQVRIKYHFWRWGKRDPNRRVTLALSYDQVQAKVFENHSRTLQTVNARIDLSKLEGFYQ